MNKVKYIQNSNKKSGELSEELNESTYFVQVCKLEGRGKLNKGRKRKYHQREITKKIQQHDSLLTTGEAAEILDCHQETIHNRIHSNKIKARKVNGVWITRKKYIEKFKLIESYKEKAWLKNMYCKKEKSAYEIAKESDVSKPTILYWLHQHKIETRGN